MIFLHKCNNIVYKSLGCYEMINGNLISKECFLSLAKVSAIVLNYNGVHLLPDCLQSLQEQTYKNLEIIVVDNASVDNSRQVAESYEGVRFLQLDRNYGLSVANNKAAQKAEGEYLFIVNNDVRLDRECIFHLVTEIEKSPDVFAIDPTQYDWEGTKIINRGWKFRRTGFFTGHLPFLEFEGFNVNGETIFACAGAMLVRKKMFDELGGFDSTFFIDNEDFDLCWRAWTRGWRCVYVPEAILYHKVGMSTDERMREMGKVAAPKINLKRAVSYQKNLQRFVLKTMPLRMVTLFFLSQLLLTVTGGFTSKQSIKGRIFRSFARIKAFGLNLLELKEIFRERKEIFRTAKFSSKELIDKFLHHNPIGENQ